MSDKSYQDLLTRLERLEQDVRIQFLDDALRIEAATNRWLQAGPTRFDPSRLLEHAVEDCYRRIPCKTLPCKIAWSSTKGCEIEVTPLRLEGMAR